MSRTLGLGLSLLLPLFGLSVWASAPDYAIHQEYTSTRALGMGNAFLAVVDDHNSLFYNPAALALRKDTVVRLMLRAGADADVFPFKKDIDAAGNDPTKMNAALEKHYGEHMYLRVPTIGGIIAKPKWSFAIIPVDMSLDMSLHRSIGPSVFVNAYLDTTIAYGRGKMVKIPWFNKKRYPLAIGWSLKTIHRLYYSDIIQAAQLVTDNDLVNLDKSAEGLTLDADLGFLYSPPNSTKHDWIQPSFGMVLRNAFDYGFPVNFKIYSDNPKEPPRLERRLDVGGKIGLPNFWVFEPKFALDIRDIGHRNWTPMKGLHAGSELYWRMYNWWKGHWSVGINQGYLTAGFGARMAVFQLDLATWGEEVGTNDSKRESRRYIAECSLDF